jgi:hypothetical protein
MSAAFDKLRSKLAELFQLDAAAELDFGIYRILNARRVEVEGFLDSLQPQVDSILSQALQTGTSELKAELDKAESDLRAMGLDDAAITAVPKIRELREKIATSGSDPTALTHDIFSHLTTFFSRYYKDGDFLSLRRYKRDTYAIPYEGEEVKLHWANADQYYIKSAENFRDYTFKLTPAEDAPRVTFKLVEADTQKDNTKAAAGQERRFVYQGVIESEDKTHLTLGFAYLPLGKDKKQADLNKQAIEAILKDAAKGPFVALAAPDKTYTGKKKEGRTLLEKDYFKRFPVKVDWYPRIEAMKATGQKTVDLVGARQERNLEPAHIAFLDREAIYLRLQQFKNERGFYNLRMERETINELLVNKHWYSLYIPPDELTLTRFDRVRIWQQIAEALLTAYCERLYKYRKQDWESEHAEVFELAPDDPNFFSEYTFMVEKNEEDLIEQIKTLEASVRSGKLFSFRGVQALGWNPHLYAPLIHISGNAMVELSPVELNPGEWQFINDLKKFHQTQTAYFEKKELYVLRNRSKKGIGFFEAGNFYPDFIVWLLVGDTQYVTFVDPKGLLHTQGFDDPKIAFASRIKELEARLKHPGLVLNSFIVSSTSFRQIHWWDKLKSEEDFAKAHVLLQNDEPETYIAKLFELICKPS